MLRTALQPRWWPLHALLAGVLTACVLLADWQLGSARTQPAAPPATAAPVAVERLLAPQQPFPGTAAGRRVVASGRWDGARQQLVVRAQDGRPGYWLLTPLRTDDGAALPVVRGWVPSPTDPAAAAPDGPAEVVGVLYPPEATSRAGGAPALPPGQLAAADPVELVQRWPYPLYNGFVVLASADPAPDPQPALVPPADPPPGEMDWRSLGYGVQWLLFAAFAVLLWWRTLREAARGPDPAPVPAVDPDPDPDPKPEPDPGRGPAAGPGADPDPEPDPSPLRGALR